MTTKQRNARRARVQAMNTILRTLYPDPRIALNYSNGWELVVAVQLSAQCTDERVNKVTETLFKTYTTIEAYRDASQAEMEQAVFQCGFYRNKAKNIRGAAGVVLDTFGGEIPNNLDELLTIPGVARKTANVVLSNLYGIAEGIAVDTHVRRFAIRFDLSDYTDPVRIERDLMEIMPQSEWWGFNHRLVHYGRDYCPARKHDCTEHPLTKVYPKAANCWPKAR
ncbi:MAG: endonuclease III [Candidatus Pacebacteria bacterium]|nr:endonuclease III [Candidatus Paceibacterota bacterium]